MIGVEVISAVLIALVAVIAAIFVYPLLVRIYMKMDPPPDVDKASHGHVGTDTCWQATAANMLAGAGYGSGNTVQDRADEIYGELVAHFGTGSGWTDTALSWWLNSTHNTWANNPYTVVTVLGNKFPKFPWNDANGARFIGNELRRCQFTGLSISWPTNAVDASGNPIIGSGGHAITCWGDNGGDGTLTSNPARVRVVDSDRDTGGDVQDYTYDTFTNPNPGGANEGNGWYLNYDNNHPYIKHIVTLCPTDEPSDNKLTQKVVGSYKIHQNHDSDATDLHYEVGTDVTILSYKTSVDWGTENAPSIKESEPQRIKLTVDWDFSNKPVPKCTDVIITTEFILPAWNAIQYDDVHFTYPKKVSIALPKLRWELITPIVDKAESIPNVTGGYLVGSFDIIEPESSSEQRVLAQYRFIHEYSFNQSPEKHELLLTGEKGYSVTNIRFGHSYGYPSTKSLWEFKEWMTEMPDKVSKLTARPIKITIDWKDRLPYPKGEDIKGAIREKEEKREKTEE